MARTSNVSLRFGSFLIFLARAKHARSSAAAAAAGRSRAEARGEEATKPQIASASSNRADRGKGGQAVSVSYATVGAPKPPFQSNAVVSLANVQRPGTATTCAGLLDCWTARERYTLPSVVLKMSSSVDYDALEATTSIEDITEDELNRDTLRSLRDDDGDTSRLRLCSEEYADEPGEYHPGHPGGSEELGWLGHYAKKSAHLEEFEIGPGDGIFRNCSEQSVVRFFQDIGRNDRIQSLIFTCTELFGVIYKLIPAMNENNITRFYLDSCYLGVSDTKLLFNAFRGMKSLEELGISDQQDSDYDLDDDAMAECIPSLAACTCMQKLILRDLNICTNSCAAMSEICPRMAALLDLDLSGNSINDDCVQVLVRGLAECNQLLQLRLVSNIVTDNGLDLLIERLPASVRYLSVANNQITLARQLPLLRFHELDLSGNQLSLHGPRVIAASLANPECHLVTFWLHQTGIGDEGAAILAESLRSNRKLTYMLLSTIITSSRINETGWNAFSSILCDTTSINATYNSNHTLEELGTNPAMPQEVITMLKFNFSKDKSLVAANKILQAHRHLDMQPLFGMKLDLLPHVVAWVERFAESRLDLKLSSFYQFVRAMPMDLVDGLLGTKKGKKRRRDNA